MFGRFTDMAPVGFGESKTHITSNESIYWSIVACSDMSRFATQNLMMLVVDEFIDVSIEKVAILRLFSNDFQTI